MKKIIFSMLLALSSITAFSQTTFNVRGGIGFATEHSEEHDIAPMLGVEANIPFTRISPWVFSPSVNVALSHECEDVLGYALLNIGYKARTGKCLIIPKAGLVAGYDTDYECTIVGPTIGCSVECGHLVVGIHGYYSAAESEGEDDTRIHRSAAFFTVGFKF